MLNVETKPNQKTTYVITLICNCCTQYSVKTEYLMNGLQKKTQRKSVLTVLILLT